MSPAYRTRAGVPVPVAALLGEGGEGRVLEVAGFPDLCAKILHAPGDKACAKLEYMVANPPVRELLANLAWPIELLFDGPRFAGYLMPRVPAEARPAHQVVDPAGPRPAVAARNLALLVATVHEAGHRVGDLNESNVRVAPGGRVYLIDCDSFGIRERSGRWHPASAGKVEYAAPEAQAAGAADPGAARHADDFALAVLLFQLLMDGNSPFRGRWRLPGPPPTPAERIRRGLYPHAGWSPLVAPPPGVPSITGLPRPIRAAFARAFTAAPSQRPSARVWVELLDSALSSLALPPPRRPVTLVTRAPVFAAVAATVTLTCTSEALAALRPIALFAPSLLTLAAAAFLITGEDDSPVRGLLRRCAGMSLIPLVGLWLPRIAGALP